MRRKPGTIVPFSRDYRRPPRFGMGLPPRRPPPRRRLWHRLADPQFYLRAVVAVAGLALVLLPLLADGTLATVRPIAFGADNCRVMHVVDGDTVDIWCGTRGMERVRFTGFDAPELYSPKCLSELIAAHSAKWALRGYLFGTADLRLQFGRTDRYDRRLATLWLGSKALSEVMIKGGHARAYLGGKRSGWCH